MHMGQTKILYSPLVKISCGTLENPGGQIHFPQLIFPQFISSRSLFLLSITHFPGPTCISFRELDFFRSLFLFLPTLGFSAGRQNPFSAAYFPQLIFSTAYFRERPVVFSGPDRNTYSYDIPISFYSLVTMRTRDPRHRNECEPNKRRHSSPGIRTRGFLM